LLGIPAYHVRGLEHRTRHGIVYAPTLAADLRARHVDDFFLGVVHQAHAHRHALADYQPGGHDAIDVEYFHPVVIDQPRLLGFGLGHPDVRPAATECQHAQVVGIGAVYTPLLMRRDPVQHQFMFTVGIAVQHGLHGLGIDRRLIDAK